MLQVIAKSAVRETSRLDPEAFGTCQCAQRSMSRKLQGKSKCFAVIGWAELGKMTTFRWFS